jgi:hypothetical protein
VILVVILTVRRAELAAFHAFEELAAGVMTRYGGTMQRRIAVDADASAEVVKEVHVVSFPDADAFAAYRADGELQHAAHLRRASVVATEILVGRNLG